MKRLLIVDGLNIFIRAYVANPSMSSNGVHVGGIVGTLKILQKVFRQVRPDKAMVVWDGAGGSKRRKQIRKDYKAGRNPIRLNRNNYALSQTEEYEGKIKQQYRVIEYLNNAPVTQIIIDGVEADDIISWACKEHYCDSWQKVIVSNDKDFFQILDECTVIMRSVKDEILSRHTVVERYGIHPNNFALARAIAGDRSDNLKGIEGIGLKTIAKKYSFLKEETAYSIEDIIKYTRDNYPSLKTLNRVLDGLDIISENYKIMQLYSPNISFQSTQILKEQMSKDDRRNNQTVFKKMLVQDGIFGVNFDELFSFFNRMEYNNE